MHSDYKKNIYLIDGSGFIFRAYYALPSLTRSDGLPVGAISGFCNMIYKLLNNKQNEEIKKPTHIAVIFDHKGKNFRSDIYPDYKMNRKDPPLDLIPQFDLIRQATQAFGLDSIEIEGYEADDIIATYVEIAQKKDWETTIISSDKDLMQLVSPKTKMWDTMKNKIICEEQVKEKFGVEPSLVVDVQALAGDSVDNIPGATGIGVKTASLLINQFGSLNRLLENASTIKQQKRREVLIQEKDLILISKELVCLKKDVPLTKNINELSVSKIDFEQLLSFTNKMEFRTLSDRIIKDNKIILKTNNPLKENNEIIQNEKILSKKNIVEFKNIDSIKDITNKSYENYEIVNSREKLQKWIDIIENIYLL